MRGMQFFGYAKNGDLLIELSEVSVLASPDDLQLLGQFILRCANEMRSKLEWEHEHFSDGCELKTGAVDFVVCGRNKSL